jgi:predicted Holliday junction resolvase-like endonuclease
MNLQDMLDEYINFKIQEVLEVALSNKERTININLKHLKEQISDFEDTLDEVKTLADENEYNNERLEERVNELEEDGMQLNEGVIQAKIKESLNKIKLTLE